VRERDLAFGKLAIARGLVSREAVSQCFRASAATPGRSLREELVARGLLHPTHALELESTLASVSDSAATVAKPPSGPGAPPRSSGRIRPAGAVPQPGELVDSYRIVSLLGKGGMGAVYLARHESTGAEVALKLVLDESDESFLARFQREVEATAKLRHPNIVTIRSSGVFGPKRLPYAVLEFVRGTDLAKRLKPGPLEPARAFEVCEKLARALEHAHERGILHRDLKPANVLLREGDDEPILSDFGLARDTEQERLTKTGDVLGTLAYMAPEQADGRASLHDARTDVYGLGTILYECLTGHPPFDADTNVRLLKKVLFDDPVDPSKLVKAVPRDAGVVALKCLAKEQEHRYPTARALADDLVRLSKGEPIGARRTGALERWRRRIRRRPRFYAVGALTVVLGLSAFGLALRKVKILGERDQALRESFAMHTRALREKLESLGYPASAPDATAIASVETAISSDLARIAEEERALEPDLLTDAEARTCRRFWTLLGKPDAPQEERLFGTELDAILEAAAAQRLIDEGRGGGAVEDRFRDGLKRLPRESADASILVQLHSLPTLKPGTGVASLKLLQATGGSREPRWLPSVARAWTRVFDRAFAGEDMGNVTEPEFVNSLRELAHAVPLVRQQLAATAAAHGETAFLNLLKRVGPTAREQLGVVDLVKIIDPKLPLPACDETLRAPEEKLADALDHLLAHDISATTDFRGAVRDRGSHDFARLMGLTVFRVASTGALLRSLNLDEAAAKNQTADDVHHTFTALIGAGLDPALFSVRLRTDEIPQELPKEAARSQDPAAVLAAWYMVVEAANWNSKRIAHMDDRARQREIEAGESQKGREYVRRLRPSLLDQFKKLVAQRNDPLTRTLRAIERFVWCQGLNEGVISEPIQDDEAGLKEALASAEEALDLGYPTPHAVDYVLAEDHALLAAVYHKRNQVPLALEENKTSLKHTERGWVLFEGLNSRAHDLAGRGEEDAEATASLRALQLEGVFGSYELNPGHYSKPLSSAAGVAANISRWSTDPGEKADYHRRAIDFDLRACAIHPGDRGTQLNLAWLLEEDQRLDEALEHAERAIAKPGDDGYDPETAAQATAFRDKVRKELEDSRRK
jgi:hypothetical protein